MKVIFLDIDGVLNSEKTLMRNYNIKSEKGIRPEDIDEEKVEYLSKIVKETNSSIVLSSSWRTFFNFRDNELLPLSNHKDAVCLYELFLKYDIPLIDKTGRDKGARREEEIKEYLDNHQEIENYLIIDDECFNLNEEMNKHYLKTTFYGDGGLLKSQIEEGINILNKNDYKKYTKTNNS